MITCYLDKHTSKHVLEYIAESKLKHSPCLPCSKTQQRYWNCD